MPNEAEYRDLVNALSQLAKQEGSPDLSKIVDLAALALDYDIRHTRAEGKLQAPKKAFQMTI